MRSRIACLATILLGIVAGSTANGADSSGNYHYYVVAAHDLRLGDQVTSTTVWNSVHGQHVAAMPPHVNLDGEGEGYVDSRTRVLTVRTGSRRSLEAWP